MQAGRNGGVRVVIKARIPLGSEFAIVLKLQRRTASCFHARQPSIPLGPVFKFDFVARAASGSSRDTNSERCDCHCAYRNGDDCIARETSFLANYFVIFAITPGTTKTALFIASAICAVAVASTAAPVCA